MDDTDLTTQYNTELTPEEKSQYDQIYSPSASYDYDMQGFFKSGGIQESNGHFPDTFKKPNHMTFSDESQYHGVDGHEGGHWEKLEEKKYAFTPGKNNLNNYSAQGLIDYFNTHEKDNKLVLPGY